MSGSCMSIERDCTTVSDAAATCVSSAESASPGHGERSATGFAEPWRPVPTTAISSGQMLLSVIGPNTHA